MITLAVTSHSELLLTALLQQERARYEVSVVGSDGELVLTDRLWLHSSWVRKLLDTQSRLTDTALSLADFTGEEIRAALNILQAGERQEVLVFSRRSRTILETLGVSLDNSTIRPFVDDEVSQVKKIKVEHVEAEAEIDRNLEEIHKKLMIDNDFDTSNHEEESGENRTEANNEEDQKLQSVEAAAGVANKQDQSEDDGRGAPIQNNETNTAVRKVNEFLERLILDQGQDEEKVTAKTDENSEVIQKLKRQEVEDLLVKAKKGWRCGGCGKKSGNKAVLRFHAETHVSGLVFQCKICAKKYSGRTKLRYHLGKYHAKGVDREDNFKTTLDQQNHPRMKTRGGGNVGPGSLIKKKEDHADQLRAVKSLMIQEKDGWRCGTCGNLYTTKAGLRYHAENHVTGVSYPCQYCGNKFGKRYKLAKHLKINHGMKNRRGNPNQ